MGCDNRAQTLSHGKVCGGAIIGVRVSVRCRAGHGISGSQGVGKIPALFFPPSFTRTHALHARKPASRHYTHARPPACSVDRASIRDPGVSAGCAPHKHNNSSLIATMLASTCRATPLPPCPPPPLLGAPGADPRSPCVLWPIAPLVFVPIRYTIPRMEP